MDLHDRIAKISLEKFASLPKTGKPNHNEWTVLSTIVKHEINSDVLEVLSLGTGSKCIGSNLMSPNGDILNDSHAEIICRRAFIKYIYNEMDNYLKTSQTNIFIDKKVDADLRKITIKNGITFHLFSTHVPCGDASIFPKNEVENFGTCVFRQENCSNEATPKNDENDKKYEIIEPSSKKAKLERDIFRTGAKCLKEDMRQDPKHSGIDYHILGAVRTKPGRGDPTLSVSCSDKLAKWTLLGIQGALLLRLLKKPIYLSTITIAGDTPFSAEAINRAIGEKTKINIPNPFKCIVPKIAQANLSFDFCKNESKQPCPSSIIWFKNCKKVEVAVEGRKQGVTKKNIQTKAGRLSICKKELFSDFCDIVERYSNIFQIDINKFACYSDWKNLENDKFQYASIWSKIKLDVFKVWPCKNKNLLLFHCSD